jgi:Tol biopolymer transport system component
MIKIDATTGEPLLVVPNDICSGIPFPAADGRSFFCYRFDKHEMVQVDSGSGSVVGTFPGITGQPYAASPDGRYVEYFTSQGNSRTLKILSLDNGETRDVMTISGPESQVGNSLTIDWTPDSKNVVFFGRLHGDQGMWRVPIDGSAPRKINVNVGQIFSWRFNPTGQVAFSTNPVGSGSHLELWKMANFLPATGEAR